MRNISFILIIFLSLAAVGTNYSQTLKCAHCGKEIEGQYLEYDNSLYHLHCYEEIALKCVFCGEKIEGYYVRDNSGSPYHRECYEQNVADKCGVCGEPIIGQYRLDMWGNGYHLEHENEYTRCEYCKRLINQRMTGGGKQFADGREVCNICMKEGVFDGYHAQAVATDIQNFLALKGIAIDMTDVPVELVKRAKLTKLAGAYDSKELGFTKFDKISIAGKDLKSKNVIYIQEGLPRRLFEGVLAHEMMHVWLNKNCDNRHSPLLAEGSANYLSYLVYNRRKDTWSQFLLQNLVEDTDPVYGEGFKRVKNYVDGNSLPALLQYLINHTDI